MIYSRSMFPAREAKEGRPLLIVETEANGDSRSTNGTSLVGPRRAGTKDFCLALVACSQLTGHYIFQLICPRRTAS